MLRDDAIRAGLIKPKKDDLARPLPKAQQAELRVKLEEQKTTRKKEEK